MPEMAALTERGEIARIPVGGIMVQLRCDDDDTNPSSLWASLPAGPPVR
jgi:hypothetical protein